MKTIITLIFCVSTLYAQIGNYSPLYDTPSPSPVVLYNVNEFGVRDVLPSYTIENKSDGSQHVYEYNEFGNKDLFPKTIILPVNKIYPPIYLEYSKSLFIFE
jgi:hypothetical protein